MSHEELESRLLFNVHPAGSVPHHIHTRVSIFIDGENFVIPASVGSAFPGPMIGTFNEDAHTHTADGVVHYNEGTTTVFRNLKHFFDTWGAIFNKDQIRLPLVEQPGQFVDRTTNATNTIRFLVNGAESPDFELYEPEDGDQIVISYEPIAATSGPRLQPIQNMTMTAESTTNGATRTMHIPLDGSHSDPNSALQYSATSSNTSITTAIAPSSNRSLRLNVSGRDIEGKDFTGDIVLQLFEDLVPRTTARIIQLANEGFYEDVTFHRVINDFMAQGGDPNGNGSGGSGTSFSDEFHPATVFNGMGQFAMANSGDDTNDSQFFITDSNLSEIYAGSSKTQRPRADLNFQHTVFGQVTSGFDIFYRVMLTPTFQTRPVTPVVINHATVFTDTQHAVLRVSAASQVTGDSTITVTAKDSANQTAARSFKIDVLEDSQDDRAFLRDIPAAVGTKPATPVTIDLPGMDMEGDALRYIVRDGNSFASPVTQFTVALDQAGKKVTLTPATNFLGTAKIMIGIRDQTRRVDTNNDGQLSSLDNLDVQPNFDIEVISVTVTPYSFTNSPNSRDVDNNGTVGPLDALLVINELNTRTISDPITGRLPIPTSPPVHFLDVNGDGLLAPIDALLVINDLPSTNSRQASAFHWSVPDDDHDEVEAAIDTALADWA